MSLGERLRVTREAKGVSVLELSRSSGVTRQTIYTAEDGSREPEIQTLRKLADALGVSISDLVDDERAPAEAVAL